MAKMKKAKGRREKRRLLAIYNARQKEIWGDNFKGSGAKIE